MSREKSYDFGESAYGRSKELHISQSDDEGMWCDACRSYVRRIPVVSTDTSCGEYGLVSVCLPCIHRMVHRFSESFAR